MQIFFSELCIDILAALNTNNNGSIDLTHNLRISSKSKHIDIAYHYIRDLAEKGIINLLHMANEENLADIYTKALPQAQFCSF